MNTITVDYNLLSNLMYSLQYASEKLEQAGSLFTVVKDRTKDGIIENLSETGKEMVFDTSDYLQKRKEEFEEHMKRVVSELAT